MKGIVIDLSLKCRKIESNIAVRLNTQCYNGT